MDSLIYWLQQIETNQEGQILTHWEIRVLLGEMETWIEDKSLKVKILPLLRALQGAYSHKHKSLIAKFCIKIINSWQESQNLNVF